MKTCLFALLLLAPLRAVAHQKDEVSRAKNNAVSVLLFCYLLELAIAIASN